MLASYKVITHDGFVKNFIFEARLYPFSGAKLKSLRRTRVRCNDSNFAATKKMKIFYKSIKNNNWA